MASALNQDFPHFRDSLIAAVQSDCEMKAPMIYPLVKIAVSGSEPALAIRVAQQLKRYPQHPDRVAIYTLVAQAYYKLNKYEQANALVNKLIKSNPDNPNMPEWTLLKKQIHRKMQAQQATA